MTKALFLTLHVGLASDDPAFSITGNRERLFAVLNDRHAFGYTAIEGIGSFAGKQEPCYIISIVYVGDAVGAFDYIEETARQIKRALAQEEVWVTKRSEGLRII